MRWAKSTHSLLGSSSHQVLFDLRGVGVFGQAEPLAEPRDVRVDDDAGRQAERGAEDDVRRFPPDARQLDQRVDIRGTSPSCRSTSAWLAALMFLALLR